jgi:hypothetical protein
MIWSKQLFIWGHANALLAAMVLIKNQIPLLEYKMHLTCDTLRRVYTATLHCSAFNTYGNLHQSYF